MAHGNGYVHPDSAAAHAAIECQVELQRMAGGNALIGRQLFPLVRSAGFDDVTVSPRMVYVDSSGVFCYTFFEAVATKPCD